jgi:hypothetical protein
MAYTGNSIVDYLNSQGQASDYNTRAGLAAKQGIQGYVGSAAQNTQLLGMLNKPSGAISADSLANPVQPVQLPPTPTPTPVPPVTPLPQTQDQNPALTDFLKSSSENAPVNQTDIYNQDYANAGIDQKQQQVNDITAQLNDITAQQTAQELQMKNEGISSGAISGRNLDLERQNAIRALPLKAQLDAAQGNLTAAQSKLDTLFKIQTTDAQNQHDYKQAQIQAVYDSATKAQQAQLDAKSAQLKQDQQTQTDNMKAAQAVVKDMLSYDPSTAGKIASIDWTQPDAQQQYADLLNQAKPKLTASQINAGITSAPSTTTTYDAAGQTTKTTGSIHNDVQAVLEGRNTLYNIRQTMGRTNAAAAYMQQMRDQITAVDPNFDFVASDAGGKSVSTAYVQRATISINAILPNIDKVVALSDQVKRLGIAGVDKLLQQGNIQIGNQKVTNFVEAQKLIADELGVALGGGTMSDMKLQLGFDVTDPSVKPEVFASNMALIKTFLNNRIDALNSLRYKSSTVSQNSSVPSNEDVNYSLSQIGVKTGSDGFVSPQDWTKIKNAWKGDAASLESTFGHLKNPNNSNYK